MYCELLSLFASRQQIGWNRPSPLGRGILPVILPTARRGVLRPVSTRHQAAHVVAVLFEHGSVMSAYRKRRLQRFNQEHVLHGVGDDSNPPHVYPFRGARKFCRVVARSTPEQGGNLLLRKASATSENGRASGWVCRLIIAPAYVQYEGTSLRLQRSEYLLSELTKPLDVVFLACIPVFLLELKGVGS